MNKKLTEAYALIEDMARNHYQWMSERAVTFVAPTSAKKEAGMYGVSALDHLSAKLDALTQKFEKLNISAVSPYSTPSVARPCEICDIVGHTGVECQLGVSADGLEQANYAQKGIIFQILLIQDGEIIQIFLTKILPEIPLDNNQ